LSFMLISCPALNVGGDAVRYQINARQI